MMCCKQKSNVSSQEEKKDDFASLPFEKALEKLENIVKKMESEDLPLEEMIKCYEIGTKLAAFCEAKLGEFEKRIEVLVKETEDGGEWAPLNNSDSRSTTNND